MENDLQQWFERVRGSCQYNCHSPGWFSRRNNTPGNYCMYGHYPFPVCRAEGCEFVKLLKHQDNGTNRERNYGSARTG